MVVLKPVSDYQQLRDLIVKWDAKKASATEEENGSDFSCEICDFQSNWENGLAIHMAKRHAQLEQLDGSSSVSEDYEERDKYSRTLRYWKDGKLGTEFQCYLDAMDVIEESEIIEDVKNVE